LPAAAVALRRAYTVVALTEPELAVRVRESAKLLPEDRETSTPFGGVTVRFPERVEPDTAKVCVEEAVP
jgi:hypothetical protein